MDSLTEKGIQELEELVKKILTDYDKGMSCKKISYKYDLEAPVVSFLLKISGVKIRKGSYSGGHKKYIPIKKMKKLYLEENYDLLDLAIEFNVHEVTIKKRLIENGVEIRKKEPKLKNVDSELIKTLYNVERKTTKEIGKMFNVTGTTIIVFMKRHNIPRRDPHYKGKIYKKQFKIKGEPLLYESI